LKIQDYLPEAEKDRFLEKVRGDIEQNKFLKLTDPKAFEQFIDDLILKLAIEAKKRSICFTIVDNMWGRVLGIFRE
jgi:hypothetical protein